LGNPVIHFEVLGKDPVVLQKFYKDAGHIALIADPEGHVVGLVKAGSCRGGR